MKKLVLKATEIKNGEAMLNYKELLESCLNNTPQGGYSVDEMRARLKIADVLDASKDGELILEDQDASKLNECVKAMRWGVTHKDIVTFADDVTNMEIVSLKKE